jgi:hypothetical protein
MILTEAEKISNPYQIERMNIRLGRDFGAIDSQRGFYFAFTSFLPLS